jgi:hypothetical protein
MFINKTFVDEKFRENILKEYQAELKIVPEIFTVEASAETWEIQF